MNKLTSIPLKYPIAAMVLLLLYGVVINVENSLGSQRYTVTAVLKAEPSSKTDLTETKALQCLGKMEGITQEMKFEKVPGLQRVEREKMHVFSKWIKCGVL